MADIQQVNANVTININNNPGANIAQATSFANLLGNARNDSLPTATTSSQATNIPPANSQFAALTREGVDANSIDTRAKGTSTTVREIKSDIYSGGSTFNGVTPDELTAYYLKPKSSISQKTDTFGEIKIGDKTISFSTTDEASKDVGSGEDAIKVKDNKTGQWSLSWGDPHQKTSDGKSNDAMWKGVLNEKYLDGTEVVKKSTPWGKDGAEICSDCVVMNGNDAYVVRNLDAKLNNTGKKLEIEKMDIAQAKALVNSWGPAQNLYEDVDGKGQVAVHGDKVVDYTQESFNAGDTTAERQRGDAWYESVTGRKFATTVSA
jgi:hypothetical protein